MRKSENISKYNLSWQLCRVSVKGSKFNCEEKILKVFSYFEEKPSLQRWERVYNFLEGLQRGYKAAKKDREIALIQTHLDCFKINRVLKMEVEAEDNWNCFKEDSMLILGTKLYKDLFKRSEKWLKSGYFHKEQETFIDKLHEALINKGWVYSISDRHSMVRLKELRVNSLLVKNKHSFFF